METGQGNGSTKGSSILEGAIKIMHATYVGYQGWAEEWTTDNPDLSARLLNRIGYWLHVDSVSIPDTLYKGKATEFSLIMKNWGVAPVYNDYSVQLKIKMESDSIVYSAGILDKSGLQPGNSCTMSYPFTSNASFNGTCTLYVKIIDTVDTKKAVDLALTTSIMDPQGYYRLGTSTMAPTGSVTVYTRLSVKKERSSVPSQMFNLLGCKIGNQNHQTGLIFSIHPDREPKKVLYVSPGTSLSAKKGRSKAATSRR